MSYKEGIVSAITELKDRNGSSMISIKKFMQANLPKDKKWINGIFLNTLRHGVEGGDFIQVKASYKLSPEFKKGLAKKKPAAEAAPKKKPAAKKAVAKTTKAPAKKKVVAKKATTTVTKKAPAKKKTVAKKATTTVTKKAPTKKTAAVKKAKGKPPIITGGAGMRKAPPVKKTSATKTKVTKKKTPKKAAKE